MSKIKNFMIGSVTTIVVLVVLLNFMTTAVPLADSAVVELGDADRCTAQGGFYNTSQEACLTNSSTTATAQSFTSTPLSSLFTTNGVIILIVMVAMVLAIFAGVMGRKK